MYRQRRLDSVNFAIERTTMKPDEKRFNHNVLVRCPEKMGTMIDRAAARRFQKPSEYVRQAIVQSLKADGLEFGETAA